MQYKISGDNLQLVTVSMKPGEEVNAEAGAMIYKTGNVNINIASKGVTSVFKRMLTKESLFLTKFTSVGGEGLVGFAAKVPGKVKKLVLKAGEHMIAEKGAYLCSDSTITIDIHLVKKLGAGLLGGEGLILQKLTGPGTVLIHAAGDLIEYNLSAGQSIDIDTTHLVAFEPSVDYSLKKVGNIKTMAFGKEGLFLAKMTGPGKVIMQSMTKRMFQPQTPRTRGSGSSLGGFVGDLASGVNK